MLFYVLCVPYDKKGKNLFKHVSVTNADRKTLLQWEIAHRKGREHVKNSFGIKRFEWSPGNKRLPIADYPASSEPGGIYSQKAIEVLGGLLEQYGDIHPLVMKTGESYFLFDLWSFVTCEGYKAVSIFDGGYITSIDIAEDTVLPEIFIANDQPGMIVSERFKQLAENAGLTGMVFYPVQVNRIEHC